MGFLYVVVICVTDFAAHATRWGHPWKQIKHLYSQDTGWGTVQLAHVSMRTPARPAEGIREAQKSNGRVDRIQMSVFSIKIFSHLAQSK